MIQGERGLTGLPGGAGRPVPPGLDNTRTGPPPVTPGAMLAPGYRVVGFLRRGRDLDVYDLWSEDRACRCVGKTIRPDRRTKTSAHTKLQREGSLLLTLSHPHIVRGYEVLTAPVPLVVMETLPGETLAHLIVRRRKRLSAVEIAHLGLHLCSAVGYLHRQGVLHLDLKPSNIIATQGLAKVLDLSVARSPGCYPGGIGTVGYLSPEQAQGGQLDSATDVWGIGAVLYEAATRKPVCAIDGGLSAVETRKTVCRPQPVGVARRLPQAMAAVIDACLDVDPSRRPTILELTMGLDGIVQAAKASTPQELVPPGSALTRDT